MWWHWKGELPLNRNNPGAEPRWISEVNAKTLTGPEIYAVQDSQIQLFTDGFVAYL